MPKIITDNQTKMIVEMIRTWPADQQFNWKTICLEAQSILDWSAPPTRQGLDKKPAIKFSYMSRKELISKEKSRLSSTPKPKNVHIAAVKISKLTKENEALRNELSKMAEIANRFIYNASLAGLSREKLMAPLPALASARKTR